MQASRGVGCVQCPRACKVRRDAGQLGFCRVPENFMVSRVAPHFWEEPCISGEHGSGAIFFSGCNLGCVFCQNHVISRGGCGRPISEKALINEMLRLQDEGVHNINLVTPSHYALQLASALANGHLAIPVVWNSSAYDSVETLKALEGRVSIYLPDLKYLSPALSAKYSNAPDYPEVATAAIKEMYRQVGAPRFDDHGMLQSGLIVRHLILPGNVENTLDVIDWYSENFPGSTALFSLMAQYTPMPDMPYPELSRRITQEEYDRVMSYLSLSEIENGYVQERDAAGSEYIPEFY
ncbi:MAG: radical SAM protein [Oscillospiraceae bacterium]